MYVCSLVLFIVFQTPRNGPIVGQRFLLYPSATQLKFPIQELIIVASADDSMNSMTNSIQASQKPVMFGCDRRPSTFSFHADGNY